MMRGSKNEESSIQYLREGNIVFEVFDTGMFGSKENPILTPSPETIELLQYPNFEEDFGWESYRTIDVGGKRYGMALVEVKTAVTARLLGVVMGQVKPTYTSLMSNQIKSPIFIPRENITQLLLNMIVTKMHFALYICTTESSVVSEWILYCSENIRDGMESSLVQVANIACGWAHHTTSIPGFNH